MLIQLLNMTPTYTIRLQISTCWMLSGWHRRLYRRPSYWLVISHHQLCRRWCWWNLIVNNSKTTNHLK